MNPNGVLLVSMMAWWGLSCAAQAAPCEDAPVDAGIAAICGIDAPEDVVLFADRYLIVSSMAPADSLFMIDTRDDAVSRMATVLADPADDLRWGDSGCTAPSALVSHGLDLSRDAQGRWRLLVVSHGEREAVEFFELTPGDAGAPSLQWRGCVLTPEKAKFNDVAGLPDGGYLATDPSGATCPRTRALLGIMGFDVGRVYRWHPESGHAVVPGSGAPYPNGIVVAPDAQSFFVNIYFRGEVRHQHLETGELLGSVDVPKPDNTNWSADGRLLVASHRDSITSVIGAVESAPGERNSIPFAIVEVDPVQMTATDLFVHDGSALGGGTAAVQAGDSLYIGAFRGDRLLKVELKHRGP